MKYGEGKDYNCWDKAEQNVDLTGVGQPTWVVYSTLTTDSFMSTLCVLGTQDVERNKTQPIPAKTQFDGIV